MRPIFHRHAAHCILPPHILRNIATNAASKELRDFAVQALDLDHTLRTSRLSFTLSGGLQLHQQAQAAVGPQEKRTIYDDKQTQNLPGTLVRAEGQPPVADNAVNQAYDGLGDTFDFYLAAYNRNSIDNAGLALEATVHFGQKYDNAFWNGQQMVFGDGDGVIFTGFTGCTDVIGHELTHGVTEYTAALEYSGESGALNESMSDVFGSLVKQYSLGQSAAQADWLIGAGLFTSKVHGQALRSMKAPGTAYDDPVIGKDPQPADMAHYQKTSSDNGGVHINSGIPNRAFYLAAVNLGGKAWTAAGRIWYATLLRLRSNATFQDAANTTVAVAGELFKGGEQRAVRDAWAQVGITVS